MRKRKVEMQLAIINAVLNFPPELVTYVMNHKPIYEPTEREIEIIHKVEQDTIAKAKAKRERKALGRKHYESK